MFTVVPSLFMPRASRALAVRLIASILISFGYRASRFSNAAVDLPNYATVEEPVSSDTGIERFINA
jgi:hypothetical protein